MVMRMKTLPCIPLALCSVLIVFSAGWPARVFAPYMYINADDDFQATQCAEASGQKFYTLASDVSSASALKAHEQCQAIDAAIQIGLTPMIGQIDQRGEIYTQEDARALLAWAQALPWVCSLSSWASNRDTGKPGKHKHDNTTSGIAQEPWGFTQIFRPFTTVQ